MPSRFEPCGLLQMYAMAYGAVPVVHAVGGLADTVTDATPVTLEQGSATGFHFFSVEAASLLAAVQRALRCREKPELWRRIVAAGMARDCSWDRVARQYEALYEDGRPGPSPGLSHARTPRRRRLCRAPEDARRGPAVGPRPHRQSLPACAASIRRPKPSRGRPVRGVRRLGKRIVLALDDDLFLVVHLMIAGRLHWKPAGAKLTGRNALAAFDFADGSLVLTEAGSKRRASLHVVRGETALAAPRSRRDRTV